LSNHPILEFDKDNIKCYVYRQIFKPRKEVKLGSLQQIEKETRKSGYATVISMPRHGYPEDEEHRKGEKDVKYE